MDGTHVMQQHMTESSHWTRERVWLDERAGVPILRSIVRKSSVDFPTFVFFILISFLSFFLFQKNSRKIFGEKKEKILTKKI